MPRQLSEKIVARNKIVKAERAKILAIKDEAKRKSALRANFVKGGIIPISGSQAHKAITKEYHLWLTKHGHPLPDPNKAKRKKKKKSKKEKKSKKSKKSANAKA